MKYINKLFIISVIWLLAGCNATELDLLDNPNAVTPDKAGVDFLYNSVQGGFIGFYNSTWGFTSGLSRMTTIVADNYNNAYNPNSFNGIWRNAYSELFPDVDALTAITDEKGFGIHGGSARLMKAYVMVTLVDIFGNVPYSEALKGTDPISPKVDQGRDVYNAALALIDQAIGDLSNADAPKPAYDNFYGGNRTKWITFANTLKLKIYCNLRLVDDVSGQINKLISDGDLISDASEDLQTQYGTNRDNPNSRHPFYNNSYETADGDYMSNYYMWLMREEKGIIDPRIRFYFYRQDLNLEQEIQDVTLWSCIYTNAPDTNYIPDHYAAIDPNLPYCIASYDGYVGRDHLNGEGIPPDGPFRTVYGLYPAGGQFDDNSAQFTQKSGTLGALGQGINPIMLSSFVDFMLAEAALMEAGVSGDPRALLESAVRKSIDKVLSFKSLADLGKQIGQDANGNPIFASALIPTQADIDEYVNIVMNRYDNAPNADGKLDVIIKEYLIASWGNGIEAYNNFRRTGKPAKIQPGILTGFGEFIRSALYPGEHVNLNANASQKATTEQVFWDNNPAGFIY